MRDEDQVLSDRLSNHNPVKRVVVYSGNDLLQNLSVLVGYWTKAEKIAGVRQSISPSTFRVPLARLMTTSQVTAALT